MRPKWTRYMAMGIALLLAIVMAVTLIPIGILAAMGIDGDSLFQYAGHIICYLAHRRKLHLRRVGYKYDQRQLRKKKSRKKKA